jgi:hypothetical protein
MLRGVYFKARHKRETLRFAQSDRRKNDISVHAVNRATDRKQIVIADVMFFKPVSFKNRTMRE